MQMVTFVRPPSICSSNCEVKIRIESDRTAVIQMKRGWSNKLFMACCSIIKLEGVSEQSFEEFQ